LIITSTALLLLSTSKCFILASEHIIIASPISCSEGKVLTNKSQNFVRPS
jgi:hypothetical protein